MKTVNRFRYLSIGTGCILLLATGIFSWRASVPEGVGNESTQHDVSWSGINGRLEAAQLEKLVAKYSLTLKPSDAEAAVMFYHILVNRIRIWGVGEFKAFIDLSPRTRSRFEKVAGAVEGLEDSFNNIADYSARTHILAVLDEVAPLMNRIGADAHTKSVAEVFQLKEDLRNKRHVENLLIWGLIGAGTFLLALTTLQNRSLRQALINAGKNAEKFAFIARHDLLTSLPNRSAFNQAFEDALRSADLAGSQVAVLAMDLDGFKNVNDTLGHAVGDALLTSVAERLARTLSSWGPDNTAFRIGGDEFLGLLQVAGGQKEAQDKANRLLAALREAHNLPDGRLMARATIGIAVSGGDRAENAKLPLNADLALNHAKAAGKGTAAAYDHSMREGIARRNRIEAALASAIHNHEITPYYQIQISLKTGQVIGVEALARWHHADLGWISPLEFIPIAEASGQVVDIGRIILEAACRDALALPEAISVAVNLSVVQLARGDMVETVAGVLEKTGLPPSRLKLEVTETVVLQDTDRALTALRRLKNLGITIALDDFGTGYSALSYLRMFNWDELKIDRSFVSSINSDARSLFIIKAVATLARQLNMEVVAEGVESHAQLLMLQQVGCTVGQGYHFGRPVPATELHISILRTMANGAVMAHEAPDQIPAPNGASPRLGLAETRSA